MVLPPVAEGEEAHGVGPGQRPPAAAESPFDGTPAAGAGAAGPAPAASHQLPALSMPSRFPSNRGLASEGGEEAEDWIISGQTSRASEAESDDGAMGPSSSRASRGGHSTPGRVQSGTFTPCSPSNGGMGRKRLSFSRMDNLPQVRVDIQHLFYYASSVRRRRRWPIASDWWRRCTGQPQQQGANAGVNSSLHSTDFGSDGGLGAGVEKAPAAILNISLSFTPGQLLGLMGPSGSGKTTLLRVLHGAPKYVKNAEGTVLVNGTPVGSIHSAFRKMCSFVPQEDVLLPSFTVQETLLFGAELRLPQSETREQRRETVEKVMQELGLGECRDVVVGGVEQAGGISGGQRRRVSIGLELLTDPSVLLLDEPTSGLDSKTAQDICTLLQQLAGPERCVAASIHQPSYQVFMGCFDRILFLVKGEIAYDGPPSRLATFFASLGFEAPAHENPANFYLRVLQDEADVVIGSWQRRQQLECEAVAVEGGSGLALGSSGGVGSSGALASRGPRGLRAALASLPLGLSRSFHSLPGSMANSRQPSRVQSSDSLVLHGGEVLMLDREANWLGSTDFAQQQNSQWFQFRILLRRMLLETCNDRKKMLAGFGMEVFTGLVVGLVWLQQEVSKQKSIFAMAGVFCMLVTIAVFDSFIMLVLSFPLARQLHLKEFRNGYYTLPPFFFASLVSAFLTSASYLLSDATLVFFMVGMEFTWARFLTYAGLLVLGSCIGAALGFLMGVLTSDIRRVQQVAVPLLLPQLVFSGYMIRPSDIPVYLRWIYHVSTYQYLYSSLAINFFKGRVYEDCPDELGANGGCVRTGEQVLRHMDVDPDALGRNVGILCVILAVVLATGYAALRHKSQ